MTWTIALLVLVCASAVTARDPRLPSSLAMPPSLTAARAAAEQQSRQQQQLRAMQDTLAQLKAQPPAAAATQPHPLLPQGLPPPLPSAARPPVPPQAQAPQPQPPRRTREQQQQQLKKHKFAGATTTTTTTPAPLVFSGQVVAKDPKMRVDCGYPGIKQDECEKGSEKNCQFAAVPPAVALDISIPECFHLRADCGWYGITQEQCNGPLTKGKCVWKALTNAQNPRGVPQCTFADIAANNQTLDNFNQRYRQVCTKWCSEGKACGDTCIPKDKECTAPPNLGTACNVCKVCDTGKACGNSCIDQNAFCFYLRGCAVDRSELQHEAVVKLGPDGKPVVPPPPLPAQPQNGQQQQAQQTPGQAAPVA